MNQEQAEQGMPLPQRVYEGMTVYDREGQVVGVVDVVYFGGASEEAIQRVLNPEKTAPTGETGKNWSIFDADNMPAEVRADLMRNGYIRIKGPDLTGAARYLRGEHIQGVFTEQIDDALQDVIRLRLSRSELINT